MEYKNILVICNNFPDKGNTYIGGVFIKEQINYLEKHFENIYVISAVAYGVDYLRKTNQENYSYGNVHAYFPKYLNFPIFYSHKQNIWKLVHKNAILKLIEKKKIKFDLIHAHYTWPSGAVAVELKKIFGVPVVITEHTSRTFNNAIEKKASQFIRTWKLSDAIIRVKQNDMHLFNSVGIPLNKVNYIPNGYDHTKFRHLDSHDCRKSLNLPFDKKIILTVGSLLEIKGHKYLVEAMSEVVKHRKDVLCIIVGEGKLGHKLIKQIKSAGLQDYVKLVGGKPHNDIPIWMNGCDIFVLPSLNEGNPTVMFECLGCGKPFVGTRVGGIPEIILCDDFGLLCDPADSEKLANNLVMALDHEWNLSKIVEYSSRFTWDTISNNILNVYSQIGSI